MIKVTVQLLILVSLPCFSITIRNAVSFDDTIAVYSSHPIKDTSYTKRLVTTSDDTLIIEKSDDDFQFYKLLKISRDSVSGFVLQSEILLLPSIVSTKVTISSKDSLKNSYSNYKERSAHTFSIEPFNTTK